VDRAGKAQRDLDVFYPYLLIRSKPGDDGRRPIQPSWRSPDVWLLPGHPELAPGLPAPRPPGFDESFDVAHDGEDHTIYAHIWNLGLAPAAGVRVEFYIAPNSSRPETAQLIGVEHVNLAPRLSSACHQLVKCRTSWKPVLPPASEALSALFVRVSAIDDRPSATDGWRPYNDRHVAARRVLIISPN
jgi:hypothetical protein